MSELAVVSEGGGLERSSQSEVVKRTRDKIEQAREDRKQYEGTWQLNLAYAAGHQWTQWDRFQRTLRRIEDVDPAYSNRELYTADVITEYRMLALGELGSDDDRPELLLLRDDPASENYAAAVNRALGFGWDHEWHGDEALAEADRLCIDLGTSAIRCRFDPTVGEPRDEVPHLNGQPILDGEYARELLSGGPRPDVTVQSMLSGRITWEPLSIFNILWPPGVTHEKYFPWDCIVRPILLSKVKDEFGPVAGDLREDNDITSSLGRQAGESQGGTEAWSIGESRTARLRDHVWLYTFYERPTGRYPRGRVFHFGGGEMKLLRVDDRLPYKAPDGSYRAGIAYFHWWRVSGRFPSRGLVQAMTDGQRSLNKRRTQANEIIDKGLPYVLATEGTDVDRKGIPLEIVRYPQSGAPPTPVQGIGPGTWMSNDVQEIREDLERAAGIRAPSLGENPANVNTYSQLARLAEADQVKREVILSERKLAIARLVEDSVYDIRQYWGAEKHIQLAGEDDQVEAETFNATKIPDFFIVKVPKGAVKPRSQAAELKKVEDIWDAALNSGAVTVRPDAWVAWLKESLEAGQPQELPPDPSTDQMEKAYQENHVLNRGELPPVAYYDPSEVHIPVHRSGQVQAEMGGNIELVEAFEVHIQEHLVVQKQNIQVLADEGGLQGQLAPPGEEEETMEGGEPGGGTVPEGAAREGG